MHRAGIAIILLLIFSFSCKKKADDPFIPVTQTITSSNYPPASDFIPLNVGNYWIMEEHEVDTSGTDMKTGVTDSIYISDRKVQNGYTYYGIHSRNGTIYLRDSGNHTYLDNDSLYFSTATLGDTLRRNTDSIGRTAYYMVDENFAITVPAGTFISYTVEGRVQVQAITGISFNPRYSRESFGLKTGPLQKRYFNVRKPGYYEMRLVRYQVH